MMIEYPTLTTNRLILRPFTLADAPKVQQLVNNKAIAQNIPNIPHPYPEGEAERWINSHQNVSWEGESRHFAIVRQADHELVGAISLRVNSLARRAALGYWVGQPYWGQNYATEAARELLQYGFEVLKLNRIEAHYLKRNPASGRVMQKLGLKYEGCQRDHIFMDGQFEDIEQYGLLQKDYELAKTSPRAHPPTLQASRLILRPHQWADAVELQRLGNNKAIADNLLSLPHPFDLEMAQTRLRSQHQRYELGQGFTFVIIRRQDQATLGEIGLTLNHENKWGRLGYWLGRAYWGQGYGTEVVQTLIRFSFEVLELNRVQADHFVRNPASGKVMQKAGMSYEGQSRQAVYKGTVFEDVENYAILRQDYMKKL